MRKAILIIVVALIHPIAWPGWAIEKLVGLKKQKWQFSPYTATPYFLSLVLLCTIGLLWGSTLVSWFSLYPMFAMLVLSIWHCIVIGIGRPSSLLFALKKYGKRNSDDAKEGTLLRTNSLYVAIVSYLYSIYFFAFSGYLLHKTGVSLYAGVESSGPVEMFWSFFYYSVVTITTLGYGEIHPLGFGGQLLAVLEVLFGVGMMAFIFGGFVSMHINRLSKVEK